MPEFPSSTDPWTLYWQADHLQSCVPAHGGRRPEAVDRLWQDFARALPAAARVLDLATGNGAVPMTLRTAVPTLDVTGVDRAAIDPQRHLSRPGPLQDVRFVGGVDLRRPTRLGGFDAVTSQYGVEYLGIDAAARAVAGHLNPGGRFLLLVHVDDSALVRPRRGDLDELEVLLETGPAADLEALLAGALEPAALESRTRDFLGRDLRRTRHLSGQVVEGVDRVLGLMERGQGEPARMLAGTLVARLRAERDRLEQLLGAALAPDELEDLVAGLVARGLDCDAHRPLATDPDDGGHLLGAILAGRAAPACRSS
jgi:SAM-dependent methyltransferase